MTNILVLTKIGSWNLTILVVSFAGLYLVVTGLLLLTLLTTIIYL